MISDDVRRQIAAGESYLTAFIADAADIDHIAATVTGFLNASGGILFIGVSESGKIIGVGSDLEAEERRRKIEHHLRNRISPEAHFTVSVDVEKGGPVITIEAPRGRDGPYAVNQAFYVRRGASTVQFDDETLGEFIRKRAIETQRWERRPSVGMLDRDILVPEIDRLMADAQRSGRFDFVEREDGMSLLGRLGLLSGGDPTQAADVLFGKEPERRHPQCRVRFIRYESDKVGDRFVDDRWISGPLGLVFDQIVERLAATVRIQATFEPGNPVRQDRPTYSMAALREGVVNALAHRDYADFSSGASVSVFPGRIEIWNSGKLPATLKVADLKRVHPSIPTNPDITFILYLRGLMDRLGRGTQKILLGCKELGARTPKWESKASGITLTIYSAGNSDADPVFLNERQRRLIERLRPGDLVRANDYMIEQSVSERQARRDLSDLDAAGLLEKIGSARATAYRRTEMEV